MMSDVHACMHDCTRLGRGGACTPRKFRKISCGLQSIAASFCLYFIHACCIFTKPATIYQISIRESSYQNSRCGTGCSVATSLVPRNRREHLVHTVCACAAPQVFSGKLGNFRKIYSVTLTSACQSISPV